MPSFLSSQVMIFPSDSAAASFFSVVLGPGYAVPAIWKMPEPASQSIGAIRERP